MIKIYHHPFSRWCCNKKKHSQNQPTNRIWTSFKSIHHSFCVTDHQVIISDKNFSFFSFSPNFRTTKPQNPNPRRNNHAEFFHHLERFPQHTAGGFEPDGDERVGRRLHVLHLRVPARVRVRQLRRPEAAPAQRRLPAGRKSGHPGRSFPRVVTQFETNNSKNTWAGFMNFPVEIDLFDHAPAKFQLTS